MGSNSIGKGPLIAVGCIALVVGGILTAAIGIVGLIGFGLSEMELEEVAECANLADITACEQCCFGAGYADGMPGLLPGEADCRCIVDEPGERLVYPTDHLIQPGESIPSFELADLSGTLRKSDDLKGKPAILMLWAPWCGPCSDQHRIMRELSAMDTGVNIAAIALDYDSTQELRDYAASRGLRYMILQGNEEVSEAFRINSYPTIVLVGPDGRVQKNWAGSALLEEMLNEIDALKSLDDQSL